MKWTIACYNVGLCCWFDTLCSCSCMPKGFLSAHECFNDHVDHSQWLQVLTVTHLIAKYIFYSSINCMYRKRLSHMLYYASMSCLQCAFMYTWSIWLHIKECIFIYFGFVHIYFSHSSKCSTLVSLCIKPFISVKIPFTFCLICEETTLTLFESFLLLLDIGIK